MRQDTTDLNHSSDITGQWRAAATLWVDILHATVTEN